MKMRQIKSVLSCMDRVQTVLLLASTAQFGELGRWLLETGRAVRVYGEEELPETGEVDLILFDRGQSGRCIALLGRKPGHIIGRMREDEDGFGLWEACRQVSRTVYIEKDRGLPPEQITADTPSAEILDWQGGKNDIELSVIVPVYNVAQYLPQCLDSLTAWAAPYAEFLFINDGSTDGSGALIRERARKDARIRLIDRPNGGCAAARNTGLEQARGRYIGFVDGDDFVSPEMFRKLLWRGLMGNYDLAYCGYQEYDQNSGASRPVRNDDLGSPYREGTYRPDKVQLLAVRTRVALWRCIYKREMLMQTGIRFHEDLPRFDDLPFRAEVLFAARSAACVPEYLYFYRLNREGQDVACRDERLFVHFDIFDHLDAWVDGLHDKRLTDLLQVIKLQTHGFALSRIDPALRKEYRIRAGAQLNRNMGYFRTVCLMFLYGGKGNLFRYTRMKLEGIGRKRLT